MSVELTKGEFPDAHLETPPLYVVPCGPGAAFVWCPLVEGGLITNLIVAGGSLPIHARKKVFRPGKALEVLLTEGAVLRDGARCDLEIAAEDGSPSSLPCRVRLARWDDPFTQGVLKLLASRFAAEETSPVFERYLAYISTWQAAGHAIETFPEGCIIALEACLPESGCNAYALIGHGLRRLSVHTLLQRAGQTVVWISEPDLRQIYIEIEGSLVRVNLTASVGLTSHWSSQGWNTGGSALIEALHAAVQSPSDALAQWTARQCPSHETLRCESVVLHLLRAVRLPSDDLAIFARLTGPMSSLEAIHLTAFGSSDALAVEVVACDIQGESGEWEQQIIIKASALRAETSCYRLDCRLGDQPATVWIRQVDISNQAPLALAREFMPVASLKADLFETVLHPLATAHPEGPPGVVRVLDLGVTEGARADLFVFVGRDLEALHRTIVGLSLTSQEGAYNVYLCLFDQGPIDEITLLARQWRRTYGLRLHISCYSARTSEAQVARHLFQGPRPRIFCRAGAVPRRHDWLEPTLRWLQTRPVPLLLTIPSHADDVRQKEPRGLSLDELRSGMADGGLVGGLAAAVGSDCRPATVGLPRFHTLEAFLLAQAVQLAGGGHALSAIAGLDFIQSGTIDGPDEFGTRVDAFSLQMLVKSSLAASGRIRVLRGGKAR